MEVAAPAEQRADAARIRELLARYAEVELLVRLGEFRAGSDALADEAIAKIDRINRFLRQASATRASSEEIRRQLKEIVL
jgi:type III secretion protein N (ATPase)